MALFRRKTVEVLRRGGEKTSVPKDKAGTATKPAAASKTTQARPDRVTRQKQAEPRQTERRLERKRGGGGAGRNRSTGRRTAVPEPSVSPVEDGIRRQMIVRTLPHQTQIVVLEGPLLVEHYVTQTDRRSLIGNIYLGKVRNVLPGMEAAFIDVGTGKNGVLYAGDVQYDPEEFDGRSRPRIEHTLKAGAEVMVQVSKDAMGHKGARLTNEVSLAGRYLVLVPNSDSRGISRRLPDEERRRLRTLVEELRPEGYGLIVRTASEGASRDDLELDIKRLVTQWEAIAERAKRGGAPRLLHEEPPLVIRVIREHFTSDFKRLLVDDPTTRLQITEYLTVTSPDLVEKVKAYEDELPVFERFHVQDQLRSALDRKVFLPSGGHIVIERTEALTVIDVNTGRFVGHSNLEETVLQNNLEAAQEIARQLRLRDIGGIVVIDFIDLESMANRRKVLKRFQEALAKDNSRTQISDISEFGLVEMTRKAVAAGLLEHFSETCPTCSGRGILLDEEAAASGRPRTASNGSSDD